MKISQVSTFGVTFSLLSACLVTVSPAVFSEQPCSKTTKSIQKVPLGNKQRPDKLANPTKDPSKATIDVKCGVNSYTLTTGNNDGNCTTTSPGSGGGGGGTCTDSQGNSASANCDTGCSSSSGSGSCSGP